MSRSLEFDPVVVALVRADIASGRLPAHRARPFARGPEGFALLRADLRAFVRFLRHLGAAITR